MSNCCNLVQVSKCVYPSKTSVPNCTALSAPNRRFTGVVDPACPYEDRQRMVAWLADLAMQGAGWARSILDFKPCDLWPQIRGRTVWLAGDSISQVSRLAPLNQPSIQTRKGA